MDVVEQRQEFIVHTAWHGSAALRDVVTLQLRELEVSARTGPVVIDGAATAFFDTPNATFDLARLSEAIGWPADLLALCFECFYDGILQDPIGIREHIQGVLAFLVVARPGADLRWVVPTFVASRLTEEPWRTRCTNTKVLDHLDTVALTLLDDHDDPALLITLEEAILEAECLVRAGCREPGTEHAHYELRALSWCRAACERKLAPEGMRQLAHVEHLDFANPHPAVGVPHPPGYRAMERAHEQVLRDILLSSLASAKQGSCSWDCSNYSP